MPRRTAGLGNGVCRAQIELDAGLDCQLALLCTVHAVLRAAFSWSRITTAVPTRNAEAIKHIPSGHFLLKENSGHFRRLRGAGGGCPLGAARAAWQRCQAHFLRNVAEPRRGSGPGCAVSSLRCSTALTGRRPSTGATRLPPTIARGPRGQSSSCSRASTTRCDRDGTARRRHAPLHPHAELPRAPQPRDQAPLVGGRCLPEPGVCAQARDGAAHAEGA